MLRLLLLAFSSFISIHTYVVCFCYFLLISKRWLIIQSMPNHLKSAKFTFLLNEIFFLSQFNKKKVFSLENLCFKSSNYIGLCFKHFVDFFLILYSRCDKTKTKIIHNKHFLISDAPNLRLLRSN